VHHHPRDTGDQRRFTVAHAAGRPARNQFQPFEALAAAGCSGYATRKVHSSAIVFMRVPAAKSSADWVLPCSMTIKGSGCPL